MSLQDCYTEHSYYFPRLQEEMNRYTTKVGLHDLSVKIIEAFCTTFGNLPLDNVEDYKRTLDEFQVFASGVSWALRQCR